MDHRKNTPLKIVCIVLAVLAVITVLPVSALSAPVSGYYSCDGTVYNLNGNYFGLHSISDGTSTKAAFCVEPFKSAPPTGSTLSYAGNPVDLVQWGSLEKANLLCAILQSQGADRMNAGNMYTDTLLRVMTAILIYDTYSGAIAWNQSAGKCTVQTESPYLSGFYITDGTGAVIDHRNDTEVLTEMRNNYYAILTDYSSDLNTIMRQRMAGTGGWDKSVFEEYALGDYQFLVRTGDVSGQTNTITVKKTSSDGIVDGMCFVIYPGDSWESTFSPQYTDENGITTFTGVPDGTWRVCELDCPSRYTYPAAQTVTVSGGQAVTVNVSNIIPTINNIEIKKVFRTYEGAETEGDASGITFILKNKATGTEAARATIQSGSSSVTISNISAGIYYLSETGYDGDKYTPESDAKEITVTDSTEVQHFTFVNTEKEEEKANIKIIKLSEDDAVSGMTFKVTSSDGTYAKTKTTDSGGVALFDNLTPGTYTVEEINVPERYVKPGSQKTVLTAGNSVTLTFENKLKRGSLEVIKTSDDGIVKGLVFKISNDSYSATAVTDENGKALFENVPEGRYTLTEVQGTDERYKEFETYVTVDDENMVTVSARNELKDEYLARIEIVKRDNETKSSEYTAGKSLEGAVFDIINRSGKEVTVNGKAYGDGETIIEGLTTDKDGRAETERIFPFGTYGIRETTAPDGYHINKDEETVTVNLYSATGTYELYESVIRNDILFDKIEADTHTGLGGVIFKISLLDDEDNEIESHIAVTGDDGWFDSAALLEDITDETKYKVNANDSASDDEGTVDISKTDPSNPVFFYGYHTDADNFSGSYKRGALVPGRYKIEEIAADDTYVPITPRIITVNGTEDYQYRFVFTDYEMPEISTSLHLTGSDLKRVPAAEDMSLTDDIHLEGLEEGETYIAYGQLYDSTAEEMVTDDDGNVLEAVSEMFTAGSSTADTSLLYIFDASPISGHTVVSFVSIEKVSVLTEENISVGVHADAYDENQAVTFAGTYFTKLDAATSEPIAGAVIRITDKTAGTIEEITSDDEGRVYFALLPGHKYTYQEIKAPDGYTPDNSIYSFETDSSGEPDTEPYIYNSKTGTVIIKKRNPLSGEPVEGAEIGVYSSTGALLFRQFTDRLGQIYFDPSSYMKGEALTFTYRELTAPDGYYLSTEKESFTVSADGTVSGNLIMDNVPEGTVVIKKTDQNGAVLPGARISVYSQTTNKLLGQATSGSTGRIYFTPPEAGSYYFVEDAAPSGYIRDTSKHTFTLSSNGVITGETTLKNTKGASGSTGDESHIKEAAVLSAAFAVISAGLFTGSCRKKHSSKGKK